jgi:hypothetical protein
MNWFGAAWYGRQQRSLRSCTSANDSFREQVGTSQE